MESDLHVSVKGMPEERGSAIGHAVAVVVKTLKEADDDLDFRRMHRIVVTADFAGELLEISAATASGNTITHTDEEYAIAVAKVLILPRDDDFEILPIINANIAAALAPEDPENYDKEMFRTALHLLHHELCHVHDDNKKIDALQTHMLRTSYTGKDIFIRPLAEVCWSEYIANVLSSSTAGERDIAGIIESFTEAIKRTKPDIDKEIYSYRYHGDLDRLLSVFRRHGEFLIKAAAYTLGYIDGVGKDLPELSIDANETLSGSEFKSTWVAVHMALKSMLNTYPDNWKDLSVYDDLALALENYYADMGLILSTTEDGSAYVDIPFSPETTPTF